MQLRPFFYATAAVHLWACAALAVEPGKDFSAHIDWPPVVQRMQDSSPVQLRFSVNGCDDFSVTAHTLIKDRHIDPNDKPPEITMITAPLPHQSDAAGHYSVTVHPNQLTSQSTWACGGTEKDVLEHTLDLIVHCNSDGRETRTNGVLYRYAVAADSLPVFHAFTHAVDLQDANHALFLSNRDTMIAHKELGDSFRALQWQNVTWSPSSPTTRVVRDGDVGYLPGRCPLPSCGTFEWTNPETHRAVSLRADYLYILDLSEMADPGADGLHMPDKPISKEVVPVPEGSAPLYLDADGSVVLYGNVYTDGHAYTILSRVRDKRASIERVFPDEYNGFYDNSSVVGDRFITAAFVQDGNNLWRSKGLRLHSLRDAEVVKISLPADGVVTTISLSPDGEQWVVGIGGWENMRATAWLGGIDTPWTKLSDVGNYSGYAAAWTAHSFVVTPWITPERLEARGFERDAPYAQKFFLTEKRSPEGNALNWQVQTVGNGMLALSAPDNLRIIDEAGNQLGAVDLPSCATNRIFDWPPPMPTLLTDGRLALPNKSGVYFFDLARYAP